MPILIVVGIAIGGFVSTVVMRMGSTIATSIDVQVQHADIVKTPALTVITAAVKNTGTLPITSLKLTIYGEGGTVVLDFAPLPLEPAATASAENTNPAPVSFTGGNSYPAILEARSDTEVFKKSFEMFC